MPKNNIEELRSDLFDTLRSLKGAASDVDLKRAKAICDVAGKIIDTGKLEVSVMQKTGAGRQQPRTQFFGELDASRTLQPPAEHLEQPRLTNGKAKSA